MQRHRTGREPYAGAMTSIPPSTHSEPAVRSKRAPRTPESAWLNMVGGLAALVILLVPLIVVPNSGSRYFEPQIVFFGGPLVVLGSIEVTRLVGYIRNLSHGNVILVVAAALGLGGAWGMPGLTFGLIQSILGFADGPVKHPVPLLVVDACLILVWVAVAVIVLRTSGWVPRPRATRLHRIAGRVIIAIGLAIPVFVGFGVGGIGVSVVDVGAALLSAVGIPLMALWTYLPGYLLGVLLASGLIGIARAGVSSPEAAGGGPLGTHRRRTLVILIGISLSTATLGWLFALDRVASVIFSLSPGEYLGSSSPSIAITVLMLVALSCAIGALKIRAVSSTIWLASSAAVLTAIALFVTWI